MGMGLSRRGYLLSSSYEPYHNLFDRPELDLHPVDTICLFCSAVYLQGPRKPGETMRDETGREDVEEAGN